MRNGLTFEVDLSEGLGLSLFLFGSFQGHVLNPRLVHLREDAIIIDVGANIGTMTLRFAQLVPRGHVYAFEPTDQAFEALERNLALNPQLAARVGAVKAFVSDATRPAESSSAYARWRVDGHAAGSSTHDVHGGTMMPATRVPTMTVDEFCSARGLSRIDFVKIDTDGHELEVLRGARQTLERFHPVVVFEAGLYLIGERRHTVGEYFDLLEPLGYRIVNAKNGRPVTREAYTREIPVWSTTDLLAA